MVTLHEFGLHIWSFYVCTFSLCAFCTFWPTFVKRVDFSQHRFGQFGRCESKYVFRLYVSHFDACFHVKCLIYVSCEMWWNKQQHITWIYDQNDSQPQITSDVKRHFTCKKCHKMVSKSCESHEINHGHTFLWPIWTLWVKYDQITTYYMNLWSKYIKWVKRIKSFWS